MTKSQLFFKRSFDLMLSSFLIILFFPLIVICWMIATISTKSNGFFLQKRVGRFGNNFKVIKIKTMSDTFFNETDISSLNSSRITKSGHFFRKYKLDELPQLFNVFIGQMSFVGPRPDVPGYADKLDGSDKILLSIWPGITSEASLKYRNEELILQNVSEPKEYNDNVIWPDKVRMNINYINSYNLLIDLKIIFNTIFK